MEKDNGNCWECLTDEEIEITVEKFIETRREENFTSERREKLLTENL